MTRALMVGLVVLLGAGEASAQRLPFTWDVPKVLEEVEVPGVMDAGGVPVKLRSVKSAEKPEVIIQHLVERFEQWDFYIPSKRTQWLKEPQFTALDTDRLISYTFIIQPNPDGTTTVVLGEANLGMKKQPNSSVAPVFPGAKDVISSELEVARMLSYRVPAPHSPSEVEGFYRKQMTQDGYSEPEPNTYRKGTEELQVTVGPTQDGEIPVMVVRRTSTEDVHSPDTRSPDSH